MNDKTPYLEQPCERCGSKKAISKVRNGKLQNLSGVSLVEYSQIICMDKACQKEFETKLQEKIEKEAAIKLKREENKAARVRA